MKLNIGKISRLHAHEIPDPHEDNIVLLASPKHSGDSGLWERIDHIIAPGSLAPIELIGMYGAVIGAYDGADVVSLIALKEMP